MKTNCRCLVLEWFGTAKGWGALLLVMAAFGSGSATAESFAVFRSPDRGRSWARADSGLPTSRRINAFGSAAKTFLAGTDVGISYSTDEARTWQPAMGSVSNRVISFLTVGGQVVAGTDGQGILMSMDDGRQWAANAEFAPRKVRCLTAHDGEIYAGTDAEGVLRSQDGGGRWTGFSAGLPSRRQVFSLAVVEGRLFAGLYSQGLFTWRDQDRAWVQLGQSVPLALAAVEGTLIAGHNPGGIHWSADFGSSWSRGLPAEALPETPSSTPGFSIGRLSAEAPVWELTSGNGLALAGASAGIFYSEDRGRTWTRAWGGLPQRSPGIAFLIERNFVLAAVSLAQGSADAELR